MLKDYKFSIIIYEAPHRIKNTMEVVKSVFGDRDISVNREISKLHEEIFRGKISEFIDSYDNIRGEFVIVISGNTDSVDYSSLDIVSHVKLYLDEMSEMDAIKKVAKERNVNKSVVYKEYHDNK